MIQGFEGKAGFQTKNPVFDRHMSKVRFSCHFPEILGIWTLKVYIYYYIYIVTIIYIYTIIYIWEFGYIDSCSFENGHLSQNEVWFLRNCRKLHVHLVRDPSLATMS